MTNEQFLKDLATRLPVMAKALLDNPSKATITQMAEWLVILESQVRNLRNTGSSQVDRTFTLQDLKVGQRVQLHPGTDRWMRGDRFGEVVGIGRKKINVKLDRSGQTRAFFPSAIGEVL